MLFYASFFSACNVDTKDGLSFDLDSFEQRTLSRDEAELLMPDSLLLGRPTDIDMHPEGFLVIKDVATEHPVAIIDMENMSVQQMLTKGRGPNEVLSARDLCIYGEDIWVSSFMEGKVVRLTLEPNTRKFHVAEEFTLSEKFMRALPLTETEFLIMSDATSGKRMEMVTHDGKILRAVGSFPEIPTSGGFEINNAFVQSTITISPDRKHTALVCLSVDYIDIYDRDMKLAKRLRGPLGVECEFVAKEVPGGTRFFQEPTFNIYESSTSDDNAFYVGYKGVEIKTPADFEIDTYRILSFDWSGKPLTCYTLDTPVLCFDVDAENRKMYVVTKNPETLEPEILIYNL